jgi:serine/threonine protein kinase
MPTQQWGPWKNVEALPEGGQGHLFKVQHVDTGVVAALKRLKNPKRFDRFEKEVKAAQSLSHPNIAALLDADAKAEKPYAVFEYVDGGSLGSIPKQELKKISRKRRIQWCEQVCDGLAHAHSAGMIHRDIKPDNLLVTADGETIKMCDFGLVYFEESVKRITRTQEQAGSKFYTAPELGDGRASNVTPAADIYSLGKVLYYLLNNGRIFDREKHRDPRWDLATRLNNPYLEHVSVALDSLIEYDLSKRTKTANEALEILRSARRKLMQKAPCRGKPETHRCVFCREGNYEVVAHTKAHAGNLGYGDEGNTNNQYFIFVECNVCGNSQRFKFKLGADWFATTSPTDNPDTPGLRIVRTPGRNFHIPGEEPS